METISKYQENAPVPTVERIANAVLWPGEKVCDWLNIKDDESRMLFRMFINLSIYAKVGVILALLTF